MPLSLHLERVIAAKEARKASRQQSDSPRQVAASRHASPRNWTRFVSEGFACKTTRSQPKVRHKWARRSIRRQIGSSSETPRTHRGIAAGLGSRRHRASAASTQAATRQLREPINAGDRVQVHQRWGSRFSATDQTRTWEATSSHGASSCSC